MKQGDVIARLDDRALRAERQKTTAEIEKLEAELAILRKGRRPEEIQQQAAILEARTKEVEFAAREAERREDGARGRGLGPGGGPGDPRAGGAAARGDRGAGGPAPAPGGVAPRGDRGAGGDAPKRARAELAYVDERLAMTAVRAPIDGEILTPRFRERVHEGIEAGGLVCEIASTRVMRAELFVPERELDAIEIGMPAIVKVESYLTRPFTGKVGFIAPAVDGEHRYLRTVVDLDNEKGLLKANMTGHGEVEAGERSSSTWRPAASCAGSGCASCSSGAAMQQPAPASARTSSTSTRWSAATRWCWCGTRSAARTSGSTRCRRRCCARWTASARPARSPRS